MKIIGKPTINPLIFFSGKISGYITWIIFLLSVFIYPDFRVIINDLLTKITIVLYCIGLLFIFISSVYLGKSTRLGLPTNKTKIKTDGIYKISRNPMYVGFNLLTFSSMLLTVNPIVIILGIYSIIVYHFIILGEEKFLKEFFGEEYIKYYLKVRRYL